MLFWKWFWSRSRGARATPVVLHSCECSGFLADAKVVGGWGRSRD